jgi:ribose transport system ATP-binding protein
MPEPAPILLMRDITKDFPGVRALDRVTFEARAGEVHALVGENGAGKSTLMKILAGALPADSGEIVLEGRPAHITSPLRAQELGIGMIYQDFNLVPYLTVAENIFLGREPRRALWLVDRGRLLRDAEAILQRLGVPLDPRRPVNQLSVAQQQMVEIAKAVSSDAKTIAMDEPSATLTENELRHLFALIRSLRDAGHSVIYISHRLEEIFEIADRVTVLRDGRHIATRGIAEVDTGQVIHMMVGRPLTAKIPKQAARVGDEVLRVEGLSGGPVREVSFSVRAGEIVGLTGLVGAGRSEVARLVFGADPKRAGRILLDGAPVNLASPAAAIAHGIGFVTEDRKRQGLVLGLPVRENVTLAELERLSALGFVRRDLERAEVRRVVDRLRIRTPSIEQLVRNLSGGNQQKVALAKWLLTRSRVLFFDEPTRGIDVGAKVEIYQIMNDLARRGVAMVMITSELPEALGMSDRLLVMREGRLVAELARAQATQEIIMAYATGAQTRMVN